MTDISNIAASLSELERDLICGTASGWGSWMWSVAGDLIAKGLMAQDGLIRVTTPLGEQVRAFLEGKSS